jgi:hypothetical protein
VSGWRQVAGPAPVSTANWPDNRPPARRELQMSHTSRTSSSVMAPGTSLLFLKTSRLAPERRWHVSRRAGRADPNKPLPAATLPARGDSRQPARGLLHRPPRSAYPSSRSSSSSRCAASSARRRPLRSQWPLIGAGKVQYICSVCSFSGQLRLKSCRRPSYPSYSIVLMMNPRVGLTLLTSSFMIFFTMVVLPALSSPLM